ncbi:T9SS type A sorting domain-containing protein [Chryseobacterium sp.]|uniref:T9SS type A sorting domain-containing protein n=1 Tax=Chryseobacterium sp. TaxID=1871047 RepID=UPI003890E844
MIKKKYFLLGLAVFSSNFLFSQVTLPFTELFGSSSTQSQWNATNAAVIVISNPDVGSPSGNVGSFMYNFYNSQGQSTYNVISPTLVTNGSPIKVTFDFAAANRYTMPAAIQTVFADDHIIIEYSTDNGATYTQFKDYEIGRTGELNTGGTIPAFFTPTTAQWVTKSLVLPAGTNKVNFKGIKNNVNQAGNFAYLDNVNFTQCATTAPTGSSTQSFCAAQTLADLVVNGSNIIWYTTPTGGSVLPSTTPLVSGTTYYASQTVSLCESQSRFPITTTLGSCLSTSENNQVASDFSIFPNPTQEILNIKSKNKVTQASVYNMVGSKIVSFSDKDLKSISLDHLVKGIYMIEFKFQDGTTFSKKIEKK